MNKHPDETEFIWSVDISCYFDADSRITPAAKKACHTCLLRRVWVLDQTGYLFNRRENALERKFIIDLEDDATIDQVNKFPLIAGKRISSFEADQWKIPLYDQDDHGWCDVLRFDIEGSDFYFERMRDFWNCHQREKHKLGTELARIQKRLR
jgi:hypothetical protein